MNLKSKFIEFALEEARKAYDKGEVPVGCVIVHNNEVIAKAHNLREETQNALMHAEIIAIDEACKKLGTWRLEDCELYVTLEPCLMCAGAILQSRIKKVHYMSTEPKGGVVISKMRILQENSFNHKVEVEYIENLEASRLMKDFFATLRLKK